MLVIDDFQRLGFTKYLSLLVNICENYFRNIYIYIIGIYYIYIYIYIFIEYYKYFIKYYKKLVLPK